MSETEVHTPAPKKPTEAKPRRSWGIVAAVLIVLAGGIAAGLGAAATYYLMLPQIDRITALEQARATDLARSEERLREMTRVSDQMTRMDADLSDDLAVMQAALDDRRAAQDALAATQADLERRLDALDRAAASGMARVDDPLALQIELAAVRKAIADQETGFEQMQADILAQKQAAQDEFAALSSDARAAIEALSTQTRDTVQALAAAATEQVDAAKVQAKELRAATQAANLATTRRAALETLLAAVQSGQGYGDQLARVRELDIDTPDVLDISAATGVPSLAALQTAFPSHARAALDTARKVVAGETPQARFGSFLRNQVGVRSLTPQDGDDPDAILSRAEAALRAGDAVQTLKDLALLPPEAQADLAPWVADAEKRQAVLDAIADLSLSLNRI